MKWLLMMASIAATAQLQATEEWIDLFDGKSLAGWVAADGGEPGAGWKVEEGVIHLAGPAGDLYFAREVDDFELEFEWKISAGGNSGLKYRVRKQGTAWLGAEYQLIDDDKHPDARDVDRRASSLYDVVAADGDVKTLKPVGEWNRSRVVARGNHLEHWLNGVKVLEIEVASPEWEQAKAAGKFAKVEDFAARGPGRIQLQDHQDEVWFRAIRLKSFDATPQKERSE